MFIITSGGPDEITYSKYFETYEDAEDLLLNNGFIKRAASGHPHYTNKSWDDDFKIEGEEVGFFAYISELSKYEKGK